MYRTSRITVWPLLVLTLTVGLASSTGADGLAGLVPAPRHLEQSSEKPLSRDVLIAFVVSERHRGADSGIGVMNDRLRELGLESLPVKEIPVNILESGTLGKAVFLGVESNAAWGSQVALLPEPKAEGYRLVVRENAVYILGKDEAGLYYGLVTLSQLIDKQGRIPRVAISDWPDQRIRGTYLGNGNSALERIPGFAALKLNLLLLEDGALYDLDKPQVRERFLKIKALCDKHFIEFVPELQSLGWGHFILQREPRVAEGVYVDQKPFPVAEGRIQSPNPPVAPPAPIVNPGFEEAEEHEAVGWNADTQGAGAAWGHSEGGEASVVREGAHAGEGCLQIVCRERAVMRVWQDVDCLPRQRYEISCHLKTENIEQGTAYIEVYGLKESERLGGFIGRDAPHLGGTNAWQRTATVFDTGEYKRLRIYVRIQHATGTAWFDEVALTGVQAPNALDNVLVTDAAPVIVQDEAGAITYAQGKDYRLLVPEVRYPYDAGATLGIELLPESRIKNGDTVLLSYTYAPPGSITCCPSEPVYQEFMRTAVHNVMRCVKPKYLHIGHDEPRLMQRDKRCTDRGLTNAEIFVDDIKKMREYAREIDPNVRIMMWDDAVNPYQNGPTLGMISAAKLIPKDVVICIWWYDERNWENQIEKSTQFFLKLGFDITGSPWFNPKNAYRWAETLYRHGKDNPKVLGSLYTSWGHPVEDPWGALPVTAEYAWTIDAPPFTK